MASNRDLTRGVPDMPAVGHRETLVAHTKALTWAIARAEDAAPEHVEPLHDLLTAAIQALAAHDTLLGGGGR